jgi:hypothetical protein
VLRRQQLLVTATNSVATTARSIFMSHLLSLPSSFIFM